MNLKTDGDCIDELTPLAGGKQKRALRNLSELETLLEEHPDNAEDWYELGCIYNLQGRFDEAAHALSCSLSLNPYNIGIECELAYALSGQGELDAAAELFEGIIQKDPANEWAYFHLGSVRFRQGALKVSVVHWECAAGLIEDPSDCLENLAMAYRRLGDDDNETFCWQRLLAVSSQHPAVRHMLAAHGQIAVPERAEGVYLNHLFDRFAADFDSVLAALDYRVPQLVESFLKELIGVPSRQLNILDAGCGTGLCGMRLQPWAHRLTGVDISSEMLAKARDRTVYDELHKADLIHFLKSDESHYDWITAGDVLCYFGNLNEFLAEASARLEAGGRLFLTLELDLQTVSASSFGYRLQSHGRYCHTKEYLESVSRNAGFQIEILTCETLRLESGIPVEGICALLRRRIPEIGKSSVDSLRLVLGD